VYALSKPTDTLIAESHAESGKVLAVPKEESKQYIISDLRYLLDPKISLFSIDDLVRTYTDVFNSVESVSNKWTENTAHNMINFHLRTPGHNLVLIDLQTRNVVGGFFSSFEPGHGGLNLTNQDLFIALPYRKKGLGLSLYARALDCAADACQREMGSSIKDLEGTTYRKDFCPKTMWKDKGYGLGKLYFLTSREVLEKRGAGTTETGPKEDIREIINFITSDKTISSDEKKWGEPEASAYVKFMLDYHPSTFSVTRNKKDKIVAVSSFIILPGRTGPYGVEPRVFVDKVQAMKATKYVNAEDLKKVVCPSLYDLVKSANGKSMTLWGKEISGIEIKASSYRFFQMVFPNLRENQEFISVEGDPKILMKNLSKNVV